MYIDCPNVLCFTVDQEKRRECILIVLFAYLNIEMFVGQYFQSWATQFRGSLLFTCRYSSFTHVDFVWRQLGSFRVVKTAEALYYG